MIKVLYLPSNFPIPLLFIVQIIFHIHVNFVHIIISLKQIVSFSTLLHKMSVLSLKIALFTIKALKFLVHSIQSPKKTSIILLQVLDVLFDVMRHGA